MPLIDEERREVADSVRRELAIENELTPVQARLFVRCIQTAWQVPPIRWTTLESRTQLDDARRLMHAAEVFREIDGNTSSQAIDCYRRAGELLEWLSRAGDGTRDLFNSDLLPSCGAVFFPPLDSEIASERGAKNRLLIPIHQLGDIV
jgi:hypothetical protein